MFEERCSITKHILVGPISFDSFYLYNPACPYCRVALAATEVNESRIHIYSASAVHFDWCRHRQGTYCRNGQQLAYGDDRR